MGEPGEPGGLRDLALDWQFLRSTKGALLGTELALCFLIFLLLTVSASAHMAPALLEGLLAAGALGLRLSRCQERAPRIHWPCLDFLRSTSAVLVFLVVSPAAIAASQEGPAVSAFTFGLILIAIFAYDAFSTYWAEIRPEPAQDGNGNLA
ncbi:CKLF-like MARVEL transmembrane domain-containing protein 5 [Gopherus flavomarginatus]|uniref:CKLF-like MARVEL transmembrane domain-containing protein 5 n=1 Tax=Gopherus flavomarginatus TaxID=286002 RepID=UPI0021CBF32F|nr:CKLF-like MARVEL transmembrane domain-containing protein 5 [Gopherus flavomarginatus]